MKLIFENWRKNLVEYGLDQDGQASAYDHYYDIKQAIAAALTEQGDDWALDEPRWEEIIIPSGGSEQDHNRFIQELQAFMQTMQLGKVEDLGVSIEPY
jgi:hypothetical protein